MEYKDIVFTPLSDIGANEINSINDHNNQINNNNYSGAATIANNLSNSFTASFFSAIRRRIRDLEIFILNEFVAEEGEYYSYNEPNEEEMPEGASIFIQILE